MSSLTGALAVFREPAEAAGAIRVLRRDGHSDIRVEMPAPFPEVMDALGAPQSRVGWGVLAATLLGVLLGFALCIATSLGWPLITGGKPIVSLPAFTVIAFECAVLVGGSATHFLLAWTTASGRRRRRVPGADPRFSADRIGLFVAGNAQELEPLLRASGAEEIRHVA